MKCISLSAPYGTLVALAAKAPAIGKRIETRSWATSYRGPLAIHQAQSLRYVGGQTGLDELCCQQPFFNALRAAGVARIADLSRGAIVAVCDLKDCVPTWPAWAQPDWAGEPHFFASYGDQHWNVPPQYEPERSFGDYTPGRWAWLLADIRALATPVPCRGHQGLWAVDAATEAQILARLPKGDT